LKCDDSARDYMYDFIKRMCEEIGPRSSATLQEHEGLKLIEEELKTFTDETFKDNFECHPGAYPKGNIYLAMALIFASYISYLFIPLLTIILFTFGILSIFSELMLMKEAVDFLFPKKKSWNIFGKIKPSKETRKIIIMGGHSDSAYNFPWYPKYRNKIVGLTYSAVAGLAIILILAIVKLIGRGFSLNYSIPFFSAGPLTWAFIDWFYFIAMAGGIWGFYIFLGYFTKELVDGANDNLSGVAVSLAVGKYLVEHRPQYIETWVGAFGCEECGQRGSKAFVKKHAHEIENSYTLIPESIGAGDIIMIVEAEDFCFTDHNKPLVEKVEKAAKSLSSMEFTPVVVARQPYADTDAMRFSEKGFAATAFLGLNKDNHFPEIWHEKADTYTCINKRIIGDVAEIILQFVENLDTELEKS
jgi:aminopeptidase YwaD